MARSSSSSGKSSTRKSASSGKTRSRRSGTSSDKKVELEKVTDEMADALSRENGDGDAPVTVDAPAEEPATGTDEAADTAEPVVSDATADTPGEEEAATADPAGEDTLKLSDPIPPVAPEPRRGGFFPLLLGGVLAAAIGFGTARYLVPEGWPFGTGASGDAEAAEARAALDSRIGALEDNLAEAPASAIDGDALEAALGGRIDTATAAMTGGLEDLSGRISGLETLLSALSARVDALEAGGLIVGEGGEEAAAAIAAYRSELGNLRAALDAQQAQNAELAATVAAATSEADARADTLAAAARDADTSLALSNLRANVAAGRPFADALADLGAVTDAELPAALGEHAETGVATLAMLQSTFPAAARDGLSASLKATVGDDWGSRFSAFLQSQVGARSLEPREGDDADAVLSRVEAALTGGDLGGALSELDALPDEGRAAMANWLQDANARLAVVEALDGIAAGLGTTN